MGQTLTHGVYLPDEGERNCYDGLAGNWQLLDGAVGTVAEHTSQIAGKAPAVHTHTKADITDLLNSNFIPSANNSYDLGSSSYQWNNLYAKNYYYNGVAFTDKFVTTNTEQTITKTKTFNIDNNQAPDIYHNTSSGFSRYRTRGSSNLRNYDSYLRWSYTSYDNYIVLNRSVGVYGSTTEGETIDDIDTSFNLFKIHIRYKAFDLVDAVKATNDGTENSLKPITTSVTDLGTSTNKWKTLNGINPGALSLPNGNAQDTSWIGDLTIKDGSGYNLKTFTLNGWITINIPNTAGNLVVVNNGCGQIVTNEAKGVTGGNCSVFIPVVANVQISILLVLQTGESVKAAIFAPCLGNV